jgi:hypothetical protein
VSKDGDEHARTPIISTVLAFRFQLDLSPVMKSGWCQPKPATKTFFSVIPLQTARSRYLASVA